MAESNTPLMVIDAYIKDSGAKVLWNSRGERIS